MRVREQLKSWAMVAMVLLGVACGGGGGEEPEPEQPGQKPEQPQTPVRPSGKIKFALERSLSETSFGDEDDGVVPMVWTSGEKIMMFCAEASTPSESMSLRGVTQGASSHTQATLTMQWGKGDNHNFYAAYPSTEISKPRSISLSVPSIQTVNKGEAPDKSLIKLVAAAEQVTPSELVNIGFEPAFSMLDISFTASEDVVLNRIVVRSLDSTPVVGDYVATYTGSKWQFKPSDGAKNLSTVMALQINGSEGVSLAAGESAQFHALLMPLEHEALEIDLLNSAGQVLQCRVNTKMEPAVRHSLDVGELPSLAATEWKSVGTTWMQYLPDNVLLSDITMPGTHDAATKNCSLEMSRCQSLTIAQQLAAGVRLFDLRPGKNFDIYHGSDATGVKFSAAMTDIVDFLNANPHEGCMIFIKNESGEAAWSEGMSQQLAQYADNMLTFSEGLTVGELRGRILLLARDTYGGTTYGGFFSAAWPDNTADGEVGVGVRPGESLESFYLQDQYSSDTEESVKIASLKKYADKAKTKAANVWLCNHTSLAGFKLFSIGSSPKDHAKNINPEAAAYFNSKPGRLGIVMMDYAGDESVGGDELLMTVINQNVRYKQSVK